jgi:DNA-binding transcriptional MocR family regulator
MDEYWATRTGRWRAAIKQAVPSLAERLYSVIKADVEKGTLPAGALLPPPERVARELGIDAADVRTAYARLLEAHVIAQRTHGVAYVPARDPVQDPDPSVGDATQIRFEAALLRAVREAAARGLSVSEATGIFRAAALRLKAHASERGVTEATDDQDDPASAPASPSSEGQPG